MPGLRTLAMLAIATIVVTACSSASATASPAASAAPPSTAAANPDQMAAVTSVAVKNVGSLGSVLVASNGYTVYTFTKDVKDSGKSACTGGCLTKWPAVTVAAGGSAAAGSGITGKLGTITRDDNGALQVSYNGLPLYFFSGDAKAGDGNGVYTNWAAVTP